MYVGFNKVQESSRESKMLLFVAVVIVQLRQRQVTIPEDQLFHDTRGTRLHTHSRRLAAPFRHRSLELSWSLLLSSLLAHHPAAHP